MFQKAAPAGIHFSRRARIRVVEGVDIPTIRRDLGDGIYTIVEEPPKSLRVFCSGKPAAYAHNGDRFWFTVPVDVEGQFPGIRFSR